MHADLALALELADVADSVSTARFRAHDLIVETKPDLTPVSEADRDAEHAIRVVLECERPSDAVMGEEHGRTGEGARCWVLDPIDGTKNYVRGVPVWGALIALEIDGVPEVGVVSAPALGLRWWAARGEGAFRDGERIHVSKVAALSDASVSFGGIELAHELGLQTQLEQLVAATWRNRGYGDFWSHMMVAEGTVDIGIDFAAAHWDLAPIRLIVEEAGGRFSGLDGNPSAAAGSGLTTNGLLHDDVMRLLAP
ncbi:MAG: inositol monophosphatase family protein [Acidimicrobiia bacterium]